VKTTNSFGGTKKQRTPNDTQREIYHVQNCTNFFKNVTENGYGIYIF